MTINPHIKLAMMAAGGAALPIIEPVIHSLWLQQPITDWRETVWRTVTGGLLAAFAYLKTSPYQTEIGPNMTANTAAMDKATQEAAGK